MRNAFTTLVVLAIACLPASAQEKPARIAVVKTWKDLQAVAPIELEGGVKIRLGLEADKLPQWSGGLIYCLTDGYTPASKGSSPDPLGPVNVSVLFNDQKRPKEAAKWGKATSDWKKGSYLFVKAIGISQVGKYRIQVTHEPKGHVLAEATVTGVKGAFHPWMPWLEGFKDFKSPGTGIALPATDRFGPAAFLEPNTMKQGVLPTFLPADAKPNLSIKMENGNIVIRSEKAFTTSRPEQHFLARYWVNDKPFVPKQIENPWLINGYGRVSEDKELRLRVDFQTQRLGAKPGDKIGLQIMHSESGWKWCMDGSSHGKRAEWKHAENLRLSNRIDFIAAKSKTK